MIYPDLGISMFLHMAIVTVKKISVFNKSPKKKKADAKPNIFKKILSAVFIATIIDFVLFITVGTSLAAIYLGAKSNESNLNIIENIYKYETKNIKI